MRRKCYRRNLPAGLLASLLVAGGILSAVESPELPRFGKDTVLVWHTRAGESDTAFVVRIAEFSPDRYFEWETASLQGTVLLPRKAVESSRFFISSRLFEGGVDSRSRDGTTLWLSLRSFQELNDKGKAKVVLDGVESWMRVGGRAPLPVKVNGAVRELPAVIVRDDRGSERWFLDSPENPLLVRHNFRDYTQVLSSITTDQRDTLRWIKGNKQRPR